MSSSSTTVHWSQQCRHFEFPEIQLATNHFDESLVIGRGGFGTVYRGTIYDGSTPVDAAIKRLDFSSSLERAPEFWAEVETLSTLRHCHVVSLFGYCYHGKERILVYEYMPNGTLRDHLHKLGTPLSWLQRLKICIGAARGLDYLHTGTGIEFGVIHRDVKSLNILLHESWAAKISDFGLCLLVDTNQLSPGVSAPVTGTFGYLDPDYFLTGRVSRKSDVYSFGVVLLEVLCRKPAIDVSLGEDQSNLARWAQESIKEGNLKHIIDSDIRGKISPKCLKEFVRIAERCLLSNPKQRPTMPEVVVGLESVLTLQEKASSYPAYRTIFCRMFNNNCFHAKAKRENSAQGDSTPSRNTNHNSTSLDNRITNLEEFKFPPGLKEFKFDDLKAATSNFSEALMLRGDYYARVYLGWVDKDMFVPSSLGVGLAVAVKRQNQPNDEEWLTELKLLNRLSHPNIISVLGYCCDKKHGHLLVHEYMQNKSFDHFLHGVPPDHNIAEPLSWGTRLAIMIQVVRGLTHLHSSEVVHRDINSARILLDQDFNAKLVDFGFAKVSHEIGRTNNTTVVIGTIGYLDPDYCETGRVRVKNDIYGLGVLFLETLTGSRPFDPNRGHLVTWAGPFLAEKCELKKIMDRRLEDKYPLEGAFECAALAQRCVAYRPTERPSSEEVLQSLEQIYAVHK